MFYYLFLLIHLFVCVALVFFILIQSNKGMGLSGAFGAMGAGDSVFGSSGGMNVLIKITIVLSIIFALMCMGLSVIKPPMSTGGIVDSAIGDQPDTIDSLIQSSQAGEENADVTAEQPDADPSQPAAPSQ